MRAAGSIIRDNYLAQPEQNGGKVTVEESDVVPDGEAAVLSAETYVASGPEVRTPTFPLGLVLGAVALACGVLAFGIPATRARILGLFRGA